MTTVQQQQLPPVVPTRDPEIPLVFLLPADGSSGTATTVVDPANSAPSSGSFSVLHGLLLLLLLALAVASVYASYIYSRQKATAELDLNAAQLVHASDAELPLATTAAVTTTATPSASTSGSKSSLTTMFSNVYSFFVPPAPVPVAVTTAAPATTTTPAPTSSGPATTAAAASVVPVTTTVAALSPAPYTTTPAPSTTTPAPYTTTPAPSTTTPAPYTTTPAPSTTTPAPYTTTPAPSTTTPVPSTTTPAPSTTTPAPLPTTPAPSVYYTPDELGVLEAFAPLSQVVPSEFPDDSATAFAIAKPQVSSLAAGHANVVLDTPCTKFVRLPSAWPAYNAAGTDAQAFGLRFGHIIMTTTTQSVFSTAASSGGLVEFVNGPNVRVSQPDAGKALYTYTLVVPTAAGPQTFLVRENCAPNVRRFFSAVLDYRKNAVLFSCTDTEPVANPPHTVRAVGGKLLPPNLWTPELHVGSALAVLTFTVTALVASTQLGQAKKRIFHYADMDAPSSDRVVIRRPIFDFTKHSLRLRFVHDLPGPTPLAPAPTESTTAPLITDLVSVPSSPYAPSFRPLAIAITQPDRNKRSFDYTLSVFYEDGTASAPFKLFAGYTGDAPLYFDILLDNPRKTAFCHVGKNNTASPAYASFPFAKNIPGPNLWATAVAIGTRVLYDRPPAILNTGQWYIRDFAFEASPMPIAVDTSSTELNMGTCTIS